MMHHNIPRTYAHAEIAYFPLRCMIRAWKSKGRRLSAFQVLMVHLIGKCAISAWAWVLAYPMTCKKHQGSHTEIVHFHTPFFCPVFSASDAIIHYPGWWDNWCWPYGVPLEYPSPGKTATSIHHVRYFFQIQQIWLHCYI